MYEGPVYLLFKEPIGALDRKVEDDVLAAVHNAEVHVDRKELIKALNYDRDQYETGYKEGQVYALASLKTEIMVKYREDNKLTENIISVINEHLKELGSQMIIWDNKMAESLTLEEQRSILNKMENFNGETGEHHE